MDGIQKLVHFKKKIKKLSKMGTRKLLKMALYGYKTFRKINEQQKTGKELRLLENVAEQIHSTSNS